MKQNENGANAMTATFPITEIADRNVGARVTMPKAIFRKAGSQ
jgi:hypothetical protein